MKKILFLLLIISYFKVSSQEKTPSTYDLKKIHQEKIFIHLNSNFLITGESLLFKLSCLNTQNNQYSKLSKIVYVEILNEDKERVVLQKLNLENGTAQSDFFIRNSLKSGNYKIIAYTKWMKNENLFTDSDLIIINPYQKKIQETTDINTFKPHKYQTNLSTSKNSSIVLNKKVYQKREKVSFNINLDKKNIDYNNLSVSVRKIDDQFYFHKKNSIQYLQEKSIPSNSNKENTYLPDARGDVIKGQIIPRTNNKPLENIKVSLSIIQKDGFSLITNTDKDGYFYFILDNPRKTEESYIQLINENINDYRINLNKDANLNFNQLDFKKISTNQQFDSIIDKKSIHIQIENAYKNLKQDKIIKEKAIATIPSYAFKKYKLDNYTRFKTIKETITEIIPFTWSSTSKDNTTFHVNVLNSSRYNLLPLLLVDGFIVKDHNELTDIEMSSVEELNISRSLYKFNSVIYKGIISISTFKGNYQPKTSEILRANLKRPQANKEYFFPNYSNVNNKNTPDYRIQLFWEPNLNINKEVSFFTSDVSGNFEIEIEGFTNSGKPISIRESFIVN